MADRFVTVYPAVHPDRPFLATPFQASGVYAHLAQSWPEGLEPPDGHEPISPKPKSSKKRKAD